MLVSYSYSSSDEELETERSNREGTVPFESLGDWEPPALQPQSHDPGSSELAAAETRRHEARVRTFPHIEGMYPTVVMIPVALGPTELAALSSCMHFLQQLLPITLHSMVPQPQPMQQQTVSKRQQDQQLLQQQDLQLHPTQKQRVRQQQQQHQQQYKEETQPPPCNLKRPHSDAESLSPSGPLHISLSHCVPVPFAELELLVGHLREALHPCPRPDCIMLRGLTLFCNTEYTRTFLAVPMVEGAKQVVSMTKAVDKCFALLGLKTFHEDPKPHMSIGWMLGDQRSLLAQAIGQLQQQQEASKLQHKRAGQPPGQQGTRIPTVHLQQSCTSQPRGDADQLYGVPEEFHDGAWVAPGAQPSIAGSCVSQTLDLSGRRNGAKEGVHDHALKLGLQTVNNEGQGKSLSVPSLGFSLEKVLCKTAQKEHVVWGDPVTQTAGASHKRRK